MKKSILATVLLMQCANIMAQVKDISFTISPFAEYNWWDNKSGLENTTIYGGKLGFGFGEYIELRAVYTQSTDLKTSFEKYGIPTFNNANFKSQDVKLTRWGGEFKANLGRGKLNPYVNIGTGVQKLTTNNNANKYEQVYTAFGLGIKTKLTDRITFTVEGKNTLFNFNSAKNLLTAQDKTDLSVTDADFSNQLLSNWSVQGALQFYLGGRKSGSLSELDKAYLKKIKGGFRGLRWVLEPSANYIDFSQKSNFRDTYLLGGYFGLDFNQFTGLRVFYLQATEGEQISTRFDKLAMYGAEFRARLNDGNGVTPYLILGGGYLNPASSYAGVNTTAAAKGQEFASAGLGMNIPLGRNFLITGGARGIVTSGQEVQNLGNPDQLQTHIMYNLGIKLAFGAKAEDPNNIYKAELEGQNETNKAEYEEKLKVQRQNDQEKLEGLKNQYTKELDSLQVALKGANDAKNTSKAIEILEQKNKVQKSLNDVESISAINKEQTVKTAAPKEAAKTATDTIKPTQVKELIKMSPQELEMLIDKILDKTKPEAVIDTKVEPVSNQSIENQQLNQRIDFLEKLLLKSTNEKGVEKNTEKAAEKGVEKTTEKVVGKNIPTTTAEKAPTEKKTEVSTDTLENDKLKAEIELLKKKVTTNEAKIEEKAQIDSNAATLVAIEKKTPKEEAKPVKLQKQVIEPVAKKEKKESKPTAENLEEEPKEVVEIVPGRFIREVKFSNQRTLTYNGSSLYTGISYSDAVNASVGARAYFTVKRSNFDFIPVLYYSLTSKATWGGAGNLVYTFKPLKFSDKVSPYAGVGLGFANTAGSIKGNYNVNFGANLKYLKGRFFTDITLTNLTEDVQLAVGYRLPF